ncbi:MAG: hypothetical protein KME27_24380 [Lyngbya sp. HA4199-MV5]|nr:hypothetical protein [Lyngbya sp. HA4199-MV5]
MLRLVTGSIARSPVAALNRVGWLLPNQDDHFEDSPDSAFAEANTTETNPAPSLFTPWANGRCRADCWSSRDAQPLLNRFCRISTRDRRSPSAAPCFNSILHLKRA